MTADHLIYFTDQATAFAAIPQHTVTDEDTGLVSLNPSYAMPVTVSLPSGPLPGFYAWISLPAVDATLQALPNNACRLIADRDAANAGRPFILYRAPDLAPSTFNTAVVSPEFAGANYPFGNEGRV